MGKIISDIIKTTSDLFSPPCNALKNKTLRNHFTTRAFCWHSTHYALPAASVDLRWVWLWRNAGAGCPAPGLSAFLSLFPKPGHNSTVSACVLERKTAARKTAAAACVFRMLCSYLETSFRIVFASLSLGSRASVFSQYCFERSFSSFFM